MLKTPARGPTPATSTALRRAVVPAVLLAPLVVLLAFVEPIPQPQAYHGFADARPWLGIPHFADVASNLPFLLAGLWGLWGCPRLGPGSARWAWTLLFLGVLLVTFGSSWYHWSPDDERLVWDRLPMTVGFMGLFVALLAEHIHPRLERSGLLVAVPLGILSVVYWRLFDDLRPYVWVQLAPLLAIPVLLVAYRSPFGGAGYLIGALVLYGLAKVAEVGDRWLWEASDELLAGHAVKHVLAAAGAGLLALMVQRRAGRGPFMDRDAAPASALSPPASLGGQGSRPGPGPTSGDRVTGAYSTAAAPRPYDGASPGKEELMDRHFKIRHEEGGLAVVSLSSPTCPPALFEEMGPVFRELGATEGLRAVVLRGSERCFSYGLDLPAMMKEHGRLIGGAGLAGPRTELLALIRRWQEAVSALAELPVPVIGAIHGWCIGGGLDIASACDLLLCSADAKISLREARIGIVADLGSLQRLPPIIGAARTRELAYTARDISAEEALEMGLVLRVLPDRAALDEAALTLARQIGANPPLTIRGVKEVLRYGEGRPIAEGLQYVATWNAAFLQSEDLGEAVSAFMARREPVYKGR